MINNIELLEQIISLSELSSIDSILLFHSGKLELVVIIFGFLNLVISLFRKK